jgi:hypothetical protein
MTEIIGIIALCCLIPIVGASFVGAVIESQRGARS